MPHSDDTVPKQCPFRRPAFWYLICCATCLGSRDNSKYHTHICTYIGESGVRRTSAQRGKTDHRLSGPNQRCYMLEYIKATFVLVCPSRAGHMLGLAADLIRVWNVLDQSAGFIIQSSPGGFDLDWIRNSPTQRILDWTGSRNVQCVSHI